MSCSRKDDVVLLVKDVGIHTIWQQKGGISVSK